LPGRCASQVVGRERRAEQVGKVGLGCGIAGQKNKSFRSRNDCALSHGITLGGAAAAWPVAARAQQPTKVARIGCLVTGALESYQARAMVDAFRDGLRERGYVEGQNILIEYRSADGSIERFPRLAAELASLKLDLISRDWIALGRRQLFGLDEKASA
jgi:hypothetical protein